MPWGSKISMKSLYLQRLMSYRQFCDFAENSKLPPFFERQKFFENWAGYLGEIPRVVENFDKIALSRTVEEIEAIFLNDPKFDLQVKLAHP